MTAARTGTVDALKTLIARGANVNAREKWFGETAVMWAASENHADAIRVFAEARADLDARSTVLDAPVLEFRAAAVPTHRCRAAAGRPDVCCARWCNRCRATLADLGANLNATALPQTDVPLKPEEIAAAQGEERRHLSAGVAIINVHYDLAAMLLDKGADPNVVDGAGMGALYAAVDMNSLQWVQDVQADPVGSLDGLDLVKRLLASRAIPTRADWQAAEASPRCRLDVELR